MNNQQQQIDLQKIAQQKNNRAAEIFTEKLNTELFPGERLSRMWRIYTQQAIMKSAPMMHRLSLKEFISALTDTIDAPLTLFQFGVLSNSIEAVSMDQLTIESVQEYKEFINEAISHIEWYNDYVKKIRDEVNIEVEAEFQMRAASEKGLRIAEA
jgi:hypothetical protein